MVMASGVSQHDVTLSAKGKSNNRAGEVETTFSPVAATGGTFVEDGGGRKEDLKRLQAGGTPVAW
jgi:hypothetical protein